MPAEESWVDNQPPRLGDLIDDYCPRCKLLLNHAIASFVGGRVVKVICQTCFSEHPFMDGKEKKKAPKAAPTAFEQVLEKVPVPAKAPPASARKKVRHQARYISRHPTKPAGGKK